MIGIEWDVPTSLNTPAGTLTFNAYPGLILDPNQCQATKEVRAPRDDMPQGDGYIIHTSFLTGYVYHIVAKLFDASDVPSCGESMRTICEDLMLNLFSMLNIPGRYCWLPTGYGDTRALDQTFWSGGVVQSLSEGGITQIEFEIDSPFPYAIDLTQTNPTVPASVLTTIANNGNVDFYPVIQMQGPATTWTVSNTTTGIGIVYDSTRPGGVSLGGGEYAEIDTFKGTIFKNGNQDDMSAGINPTNSDLGQPFVLVPGNNVIECNDTSAIFLVNNAWG